MTSLDGPTAGPAPIGGDRWRRGGVLFAAMWLVFLADPVTASWADRDRAAGWVGLAATVSFAAAYLWIWLDLRRRRTRLAVRPERGRAMLQLLLLTALAVVMCLSVGQPGTAAAVYIAVAGMMLLPLRAAVPLTGATAAAVAVLGSTVAGWDSGLGLSFAVCAGAFAMFGIQQLMLRNISLLRAKEENARLAVEQERNRFARDLHDVLGHSLTVITVKSELANRLIDVDVGRARNELADLERLSREALADVRRAVEGYRELTLSGELARARESLAAAGIEADLPPSADVVLSGLREVFAWTVREGVTNVIRHSGAAHCTVSLGADRVVVSDDGKGPDGAPSCSGHGLTGLAERATASGAVLLTGAEEPHGFTLQVVGR